jgi:hypothetical protein
MRNLLHVLSLVLIVQFTNAYATSYMKFWVNGSQGNTVKQGDVFAWEFDVASPGNTADVELWIDLDKSRSISDGDILLDVLTMTDGDLSDDGPVDSSAVPDGILYVELGQFGFAVENYYMKVIDEDNSTAANWFEMTEMQNPPATASGKIVIEGSSAPDDIFKNIMIGAMGENGIFSGLSDENGNYQINLPVAGAEWEIGTLFDNALPGYITDREGYRQNIPAGNTDSLNFLFTLPKAFVYGDLVDQNLNLIDLNGYVGLENRTTNQESDAVVKNGHFIIPAPITIINDDSINYFQMRVDEDMIFPNYLGPVWGNDFPVSFGDSIKRDLKLYKTNAVIYGYITEDSNLPSKAYSISANSDEFGYINMMSDSETGYFEISVRNGSWYNVGIQDDPEWGTPPPPGMILEENWAYVEPGDTVRFNFVPTSGRIMGTISFDEGDPQEFDYDNNSVTAWDTSYFQGYNSRVQPDKSFEIAVPSGKFNVSLYTHDNNYLVKPSEIFDVVVDGDTVDNLHYNLNYGHAELIVKLIDPPLPAYEGYWITTMGEWPNVYSAWQEQLMPDTSFVFNVCEGAWYLDMPIRVDEGMYLVYPQDTVITVTEQDSSYYVEFRYVSLTDVEAKAVMPNQFYLSQNYPNPFNPSTTIVYGLEKPGQVKLTVYNLLGEVVNTLVNSRKQAGSYTVQWQPTNLASGVYMYKLETVDRVEIKKMVFIK